MAECSGEGLDINSNTDNYLRLQLLEVKGGTTVLRNLFLKIVRNSPAKGDVDKYLGYFKYDIQRHKQGSEELKILFNSGRTNIDKWDVSLLAYVLVHCCTFEGQLNLKRHQNPREILKREIQKHSDLPHFLSDNQMILDDLIITGRITEQQYETLYRQNHQTVDFEAWDAELVLQVLFKVCSDADLLKKVRSVCRDILNRQVEIFSSKIVLGELLNHHQHKFDQFKKERKLTDNQYQQICPEKSPPDATNWDDDVLICVVINTCQSLPQLACKGVKTIRQVRKDLAHTADTEINVDFLGKWTDLHGAIMCITATEIQEKLNDVMEIVDSIKRGPFDQQNAVKDLIQCYSIQDKNKKVDTILEKVSAIERNTASSMTVSRREFNEIKQAMSEILRRMPEPEYSQTRNSEELKVAISVNGEKKDAVSNAETSIYKAINGTEDDNTKPLLHPTERIKQTIMQSNDGNEIERIEKGSIILVVKCSSLRGVHNLLKTLKSSELKECLGQLQDVLTKINKCPIRLSIHLTNSSLLKIMEMVVKFAPQSEESSSPDEQNTLQIVPEVSSDLQKHQDDTNEAASAPEVPQSSETKPRSGDDEIREAASDPGVPQASEAKPWSLDDETRDIKKKFEKRQWLKTETTSDAWVPQKLSTKPWQGDHELMETTSDPLVSQTFSTKPWPRFHESKDMIKKGVETIQRIHAVVKTLDGMFVRLPTTGKDTRRELDEIFERLPTTDKDTQRELDEIFERLPTTDKDTQRELFKIMDKNIERLPTTDKDIQRLRGEPTEKIKTLEKTDIKSRILGEQNLEPNKELDTVIKKEQQ